MLTFPVANCDLESFLRNYETVVPDLKGIDKLAGLDVVLTMKIDGILSAAGLSWLALTELEELPVADRHLWLDALDFDMLLMKEVNKVLGMTMGCMSDTLAWMHSIRIAHNDLKQANILLRDGRIYITTLESPEIGVALKLPPQKLFQAAHMAILLPRKEKHIIPFKSTFTL